MKKTDGMDHCGVENNDNISVVTTNEFPDIEVHVLPVKEKNPCYQNLTALPLFTDTTVVWGKNGFL